EIRKGNPNLVIITVKDSKAHEYAFKNNLPLLLTNSGSIDDAFYFKFEPNGSEEDWYQNALPQLPKATVYAIEELDEVKYIWSNKPEPPLLSENWTTFGN